MTYFPPELPPPSPVGGEPVPEPALTHPHREPTPYHQMYRTWTYSWWRPVVGIVLLLAGFVAGALITMPVLYLGALFEGSGSYSDKILNAATAVPASFLLYVNLSLAVMIPIVWLIVRVVHRMRPRWVASVKPWIRWRFLLASLGVAFVTLVVTVIVSMIVPASAGTSMGGHANPFNADMLALILVTVFTTPFQAIAEEYVFRGYLVQAIGSLLKNGWFAIVGSALVFVMAHGMPSIPVWFDGFHPDRLPLFFDRFAFGVVAAWLVIRTGGLEAGIAMHILNNWLAWGQAIFFGSIASSMEIQTISWWNIPVTLTQSLLFAGLIVLVAKRMKLDRLTRPPLPSLPQPAP